tara:strand:+ start:98179 stop:98946 length:768 start_codon:yes stop_codon:yes gene_type:complete
MKKLLLGTILCSLFLTASCKDEASKPIQSLDVKVGENSITAQLNINDRYALTIDGEFPINIKGNNYGEVYVKSKNEDNPFRVGLLADFTVFTSDAWDGFEPTDRLPNGDPIPGWITPYELLRVGIPNNSGKYKMNVYGGYFNPYYIGVSVDLSFLDDHYPSGLQILQHFQKDGEIWGTATLYGPTKDSDGNITQHGGIFFVLSASHFMGKMARDFTLTPGDVEFTGRDAHRYESKKAKKKLIKKIQKAVKEFNEK